MTDTTIAPLVTITIPNHNTGAYISEAIESALSQTFQDFEVLIVDNASTDNSREIIKYWAHRDSRIVVQYYDNLVIHADNWNRCLKHARGKYIVFLHADDRLKPKFVETALEVYALRADLGYVMAAEEIIDGDGNVIVPQPFYEASGIIPGLSEARINFIGWHTSPVQMLIRTECMRSIGGYRYSDVMTLLLLNLKWDMGYLHTPLVQCRRHEQAATTQCVNDKMLLMTIYTEKIIVLSYLLPPEGAYLIELKEKVMEKTANSCLTVYAMNMLASNRKRLCREYMSLARGFWLDIDQTPIYRFLEEALKTDDWTMQKLKAAWEKARPDSASAGPPYPLPEGAVRLPPPK
jgi:glycosyltransferase involved in cell wall biosynthesis